MVKLTLIFLGFFISLIAMIFLQTLPFVNVVFSVLALIFILRIINQDHEYQSKISWTLLIIISPPIGIILYILFGLNYKSNSLFSRKIKTDRTFDKYKNHTYTYDKECDFEKILYNITGEDVTEKNNVTILNNGVEKFPMVIEKISNAKKFIHLEYYIIHESNIEDEIFEILMKKANDGIEVKVLYDGYGCAKLKKSTLKKWRDNKIDVVQFGAIKFSLLSEKNLLNYRNHRKLIIVDGQYGFTGGINIGDEYLYNTKKYGFWRDTHVMLEGQSVRELELVFARDWYYETNVDFIENNEDFYLSGFACPIQNSHLQIVSSGPDKKDFSIKDVYFKVINEAKDEIIIMTPYLMPDQDIITSLKLAAKNNVKVNIIVPGNPDKKLVHAVTRSYYEQLLESGIKIYEMHDSFVHSKVLIVDDKLCSVGTTNLDFRSFNLNFELTAFIFSEDVNSQLKQKSYQDMAKSNMIVYQTWKKRNIFLKTFGNIIQLITPIM